ncbi:MAG: GGDEF domain-containing protein, partial [Nitrospinae bacterium]|nr:GGDEF domain-containing protein [Nitrospinota bacterium]
ANFVPVVGKFNIETDRRKLALQRVTQLANYDILTGCANRRLFFELVKQGQSRVRRHHTPAALFYVDLDGFKQVNDRYGHGAGDMVLKEVARRMQRAVRENDLLGRLGGDEFALLAEEIPDRETAVALGEKLIATTREPVTLLDGVATIGMSVGITLIDPERGESVKGLIKKADEAMYEAKLAGKGVCRVWSEMTEEPV